MSSNVKWSVDGFDFRIRELEQDDIPEVRDMILGCLYETLFNTLKALMWKNWRIQIVLSGLSVLLLNYIGYDAQYIAVFVSVQIFLLAFTNAASFYRFFVPGVQEQRSRRELSTQTRRTRSFGFPRFSKMVNGKK
uniref:uncharacterized protein LOC120330295 n=1 Tax=Styela clava TaxID=7725 RepID=UPI001939F9FF|nr:uncharacterized protein LOC120330295 [Styela clava]